MRIGIDIAEVGRIKRAAGSERFVARVFSEEERAIFAERKNNPQTIAGRFCVKEAFGKALGTGICAFDLREVSTLNDDAGAPYLKLTGKALELLGNRKTSVSISHTKEYATAAVIIFDA